MADPRKAERTPALEWIAAGLGLVALLSVFGIVGREASAGDQAAVPALEVRARQIVPNAAGYVVEFEVLNRSSGTAAAVAVEGKLGETETSHAVLDYVAGGATVRGGLFFRHDPRGAALELRALGYQAP